MLTNRMICRVGTRLPAVPQLGAVGGQADTKTCDCGSEAPNTLPPWKSCRARPSQKLSKFSAAAKIVGVLRGSTLRMSCPEPTGLSGSRKANPGIGSTFKTGVLLRRSGSTDRTPPMAEGGPKDVWGPIGGMSRNWPKCTPIDEATSLATLAPLELFLSG